MTERTYCGICGRVQRAPGHEPCLRRAELEPPRYCPGCGRRMLVQVTPAGWPARCARHGELTSGQRPGALPSG